MTDRYWRQIEDVENDIENAMQISSILLKLKGYDDKLSNLEKINDNENNISTNSEQISTNTESISTNLEQINTNTEFISNNLENINNIDKIKSNLNDIENDLSDFKINYSIQNLFIYNIDIEKNYTLNKDNPKFSIFSYNLEDNFKSNSILEFNCKILYNYTSYNNIGTLIHVFKLYDKNDELIHEYKNLKSNSGDNLSAYLNQNDVFYVKLNENYSIINIELILSILDNITKSVSCKLLNTFKSNFLYVKHYKKINTLSINNNLTDLENDISSNLTKIDTNKGNISSNLGKIDTNKGNLSSNLTKIDTNKGNLSSNLTKIDTNKGNISSNLTKIDTNKGNISSNLTKIDTNKGNISSNLTKIDTNKGNISSNLTKIDTNKGNISSNLTKIENNKINISKNLEKINNISSNSINGNILKKVFVYDIEFYKKLIFSYTEKSYLIFSEEIEFNFKAYNYIEIYSEILFDYLNHYEIGLLKTEYIFYDDRNIQIEKFEKYQNNSGSSSNNYLITKDYMLFINKSDNTKLKLDIYVSLIKDIEDSHTDFTVKLINNYKNKIYIKYYEK